MKLLEFLEGKHRLREDIAKFETALKSENITFRDLILAVASHSDYLEEEIDFLKEQIAELSKKRKK